MDKYEEALERARKEYAICGGEGRELLEDIFPELAESEDERIRKAKGMKADYEKALTELKEGKIECSPIMKEFIDKFLELGNTFNYGFGPNLQQEQPVVELEKEMDKFYGMYRDKTGKTYAVEDDEPCFDWKEDELSEHEMRIAHHFFELGFNARKEK